jgi:zinc protease
VSSLRKFYEHYYQPDNAVLIVAGQFDKAQAIALIDHYFATIAKPVRCLDETYTEEPAQDGPRELKLLRVGDMASVAIGYHIPAARHADHAALKILFDCLTDEPAGLIYQKLVTTNQCSENFSMVYALYEPGMALCFVRPTDDEQAEAVLLQLISLIEDKASDFLDEQQIERIKIRALKRIKLSLSNSKDMALKLSESIACGDWRLFFWYRDQLAAVSLAHVRQVLGAYIMPSNRTSGIFKPIKEAKRALIAKAPDASVIVADIVEDPSLAAGDVFVATPKAIEVMVVRKEIGMDKFVAVLSKKTRGQMVRAQLRFRFGSEKTLTPKAKEFWLIPSLLFSGTDKYDFKNIRDRIDSLM